MHIYLIKIFKKKWFFSLTGRLFWDTALQNLCFHRRKHDSRRSKFEFQFSISFSIFYFEKIFILKKSFILFGLDVSCWHQSKKKSYKFFLWCRIGSTYKGFKGYKSLFYELLFFSIQLASILEIDSNHIRNAVSLYCRLGIAKKKNADLVKSQKLFFYNRNILYLMYNRSESYSDSYWLYFNLMFW